MERLALFLLRTALLVAAEDAAAKLARAPGIVRDLPSP